MLWSNKDIGNASPKFIVAQYNKSANSNTQNTIFANVTANVFGTGRTVGVFGIDTNKERAAAGGNQPVPPHAGWNIRTVGQGGRAGRIFYETIVAMASITPTANTNNVNIPEFFIRIYSQPSSNTWNRGNAVNLIVGANTLPPNITLSYYWQQDGGNVSQTWANVQNAGTFASANGNTSFTLSIANNFLVNDNNFRVIVYTAGANNKTSTNAKVLFT